MADIRCPMCGKTNTAGRETCRYCNARLTPLIAQPPAASRSGAEDVPDWLSSLRDGSQQDLGQESSFDGESEAPDWLSRLGGDAAAAPAQTEAVPDWFANLDGADQSPFASPVEPAAPAQPAASMPDAGDTPLPDWFMTSDSSSSTLDWLKLQDEQVAFSQQTELIQPAAPDQPAAPAGDAAEWQAETGVPDWMAGIQGQGDLAGWLSESSEPPAADRFGLGDIGSNAFSTEPTAGESELESAEWLSDDQTGQSIDDWFAKTQGSAAFSQPAPQSPQTPAQPAPVEHSGGLPDWLSSLNEASPVSPEPDQDDGSPDWLDRVRARRQADEARLPQVSPNEVVDPFVLSDDPENDLSFDWLNGSSTADEQEALAGSVFAAAPEPEQFAPAVPADDTPDWLRNLNNDFGAVRSPAVTARLPELDDEEHFEAAAPVSAGQDEPDWLAELTGTPGTPVTTASVPAFIGDEDPLEVFDEQPVYSQAAPDTSFGVTPDWLSSLSAEDAPPAAQVSDAEPSEQLEPANLPTWLEAMRPVDAVNLEAFDEASEARIENAGPLAGLRGALPAEIAMQGVRPPAPYTIKLPISADVENRLNVLKSLLESENSPTPQTQKAALSSSLLVRVAAFFILVLVVVLALYIGPDQSSPVLQMPAPAAVLGFHQQLLNLSSGSHVLLALDFEPGYSAEMNTMLQPLLVQLQRQGVFVTAVSSSVSGALIIEQAQNDLAASAGDPLNPWRVQNLGYLPGGPAGLLAFALEPARIIPVDVIEQKTWADAGLNPAAGMDNFSLVIVATDSTRSVSTWAEQVGPLLQQNEIELLMVSSAQSAAVIEPFFTTYPPVVDGYLGGLSDASYYLLANQPIAAANGPLRMYEYAYSAALLAVVLFVVIGGIINLAAASLGVRKQPKGRSGRGEAKA